MEILIVLWLGLAVAIGAIASNKGRNFFGWFLLSLLLSPLIAGVLLAAAGSKQTSVPSASAHGWSCVHCAEPIRIEAKICPHCRSTLPEVDPRVLELYPQMHGNFRYRRQPDGSVLMATPSGARRFANWNEFWRAVN
ncbi:hypothetical protein AUC71_03100 [Methyloceanibacter marginalis]|uniref:Zinc ribbon domain-containing protein n=1 Tax=Methyloceanibacter marginalis TaxID=1774971 RepID=A0A1E3W7R0_9HYPH|nr:hypothetical protein [Methyloceanibacter marginalis]ODS01542.1 hypothetical protein AUC71_03100 [Methyloceanibacter marginalis]